MLSTHWNRENIGLKLLSKDMRVIYKRQLQGFCLRKQNKNKKTYLPTTETNVEQIEKNQYLSFPVLAFSTNLAHSVTIHHYVPKISPGWQKEQQLEAPFSLICETFRQLYSPSSEIIFKKKKKKLLTLWKPSESFRHVYLMSKDLYGVTSVLLPMQTMSTVQLLIST